MRKTQPKKNIIATILSLVAAFSLVFSANTALAAGPEGPPCGNYKVKTAENIDGRDFPKGTYMLHAFGISCKKVIGSKGLFAQFLKLKDGAPLPKPWISLTEAVGAPKFSSGNGVGFRAQLLSP